MVDVHRWGDILSIYLCALAAGAHQHHRPAASPSPFNQLALFVKVCLIGWSMCAEADQSLAAKTYRVQHIFYFNHFSQVNLISSKWIVNEGDSIVLHLFYLKVLLYAPRSQKWLKLVPKRIIKADQIFLCVKTALISYFCHWRRPF